MHVAAQPIELGYDDRRRLAPAAIAEPAGSLDGRRQLRPRSSASAPLPVSTSLNVGDPIAILLRKLADGGLLRLQAEPRATLAGP